MLLWPSLENIIFHALQFASRNHVSPVRKLVPDMFSPDAPHYESPFFISPLKRTFLMFMAYSHAFFWETEKYRLTC